MDQAKDDAAAGVKEDEQQSPLPAAPAPTAAAAATTATTTTSTTGDKTTTLDDAAAAAQSQPVAKAEDEESDWEELDEVLDDFSKPKPVSSQQQQLQQQQQQHHHQGQAATKQKADSEGNNEPDLDEEEILKQLEAGMAELLKGAGGASGSSADGSGNAPGDDTWSALADELSKSGMQPGDLMKLMLGEEFGGGGSGDAAGGKSGSGGTAAAAAGGRDSSSQGKEGGSSSPSSSAGPTSFQETIRKTIERMQESGDKATAAASEGDGDDLLLQVLKAMEAGGAADADDENLDKIFMGIMEQLSNKELLYEPMKELHDKFGPWLKENREKISKEELERYEEQASLVAEIVAKFEEKGYSDDNPQHKSYVWERMQKMQAAGNPPEDLVSNPLNDAEIQKALTGDMPGCPQQ
ncbi:hypothetical protein VTO42DRAFT_5279 [Malbranchea cinnamomea]